VTIYLYVKTHNKTGLKYLGKTTSKDPHKYKGSGTYWLSHIKKHGYDVSTEIIKETFSKDEITHWGVYYSDLWDVVESNSWANLKPETGDGGSAGGVNKTLTTRTKISTTMKGRPAHNKGKKQIHKKHQSRKSNSFNHKGSNGKLLGQIRPKLCCVCCKKEVDVANLAKYHAH
jgi:hypothetical protein